MTMIRTTLAAILTVTSAFGAAAQSAPPEMPYRLVPANSIVANTHLILTVPLADRSGIDALADALEAQFHVTLTAEWPLSSIGVHCLVMDIDRNTDVDRLMADLSADPRIRTVQRVQDFDTFETPYSDPYFPAQYALTEINAAPAQRISKGAGVKVAVVDSAIDGTHPDLAGRLASFHNFVDAQPADGLAEAHGTAMAGIIAADATNATGIVGVAPEAQLSAFRACWQAQGSPGHCNSFSLARALNFAIVNDFDIINMSLGGPADPLLEELVQSAIGKGVVVVAAWGDGKTPAFPASGPGVIAAGKSTSEGIPAPAVDVISTAPHDEYRYVSGSSVATAHVTGVAALLLAANPGLSPQAVKQALEAGVTTRDGAPMLDACKVLASVMTEAPACE
ncbi:S8 family peptidase [Rhizobium sp. PAMB 3182]